jgi:bifunctional enzyme CysN/CysC
VTTANPESLLRVVLVGHVDHGKSTLTGRLLADTGTLAEGKLEAIRTSCARRGVPFEHAFLLDALQAERDQNVTIDTSHVWLKAHADDTSPRFVLIDAPGHREFIKNMITGAAQADAAVLLVAADEGISEQTRRHGQLLGLLGVKHVIVVVNKMDRVDRNEHSFRALEEGVRAFLATVNVHPLAVIPVVAKDGENVVTRSPSTSWFTGPTVLDALLSLRAAPAAVDQPLRLVVQDVYRFDERRIVAGRVEAGTLKVGDRLRFHPGAKIGTVKSIERWAAKAPLTSVNAGDVFGITLHEPIFVERGQVAVLESGSSVSVSRRLRARVFWMGRRPLELDKPLKLRICTREESVRVVAIERALDAGTLGVGDAATATLERARVVKTNEVADVIIEARGPLAFDRAADVVATGRFVLVDGRDVAGGGLVLDALEDAAEDAQLLREVADEERHARFGHRGAVVSVADSARAVALERALFDRGLTVARTSDAAGARALAAAGIVAVAQGVELDDAIRPVASASLAEQVEHVVEATSTKGARHAA